MKAFHSHISILFSEISYFLAGINVLYDKFGANILSYDHFKTLIASCLILFLYLGKACHKNTSNHGK